MKLPPSPSFEELNERLKRYGSIQVRGDYLLSESLPEGIPRGVICEFTGCARTEIILDLLKSNPGLFVFWAERSLTIFPTALHQRGIDLKQVLMAETGLLFFQSIRKALKSKVFDCFVLSGEIHEVKILRALQIFAKESNAYVFFLSKTLKKSWTVSCQVEAKWSYDKKTFTVEILKKKV